MSTNPHPIAQVQRRKSDKTRPVVVPPELADLRLMSIKEVAATAGHGVQTIRDKVKRGEFPPADYRDGPKCVRWSAGLVRRWLESNIGMGAQK